MDDDEIKREMARLTLMLEENERKRVEQSKVVTFANFRIVNDLLVFSVHPSIRPEITEALRSIPNIHYNPPYDVKIIPTRWKDVFDEIVTIPNIVIDMSDDIKNAITSWIPTPDIYIDYNKEKTNLVFNLKNSTNTSILYSHAAVTFHNGYNKWVMNVSNLFSLKFVLDEYARRYPNYNIALSAEVSSDLEKEIAQRKVISDILDGTNELPPLVVNGYTMSPEQTRAIEFLKYNDGNGIVALKMGKGKTPIALLYMKWYWESVDDKQKFLILSPASLRPNWTKEVTKYLGSTEKVYPLSGTIPQSIDILHLITKNEYRIFYANYDLISRGLKTIDETTKEEKTVYPWPAILSMAKLRLVADEAHAMKNPSIARTQAIHMMDFKSSILLTGTPMKNGPGELYTLVRQIKPDFAGSYAGWLATHTTDNGKRAKNAETLREVLAPLMYRPKTYVGDDKILPINRITIEYELSDTAKKLYNQVLLGFYDTLEKWDGSTDNSQEITSLLAQIMRMKQVCAEDKIDFVAERAIDTYDSEAEDSKWKKVIIFSQFVNSPEIVERIHKALGSESVMFTGNDDVGERQRVVDRFQLDPNIHFLCCSTKAAGEGLNITAAGHTIFVDLMWTPSDHAQAEGRAYNRNSDPHSITSTYIVANGTIEDHIVGILLRKMEVIGQVIDGVEIGGQSIMKELFGELKNMRMLK